MISGKDFVSKDLIGDSDPYIIIKCGDITVNERDKK